MNEKRAIEMSGASAIDRCSDAGMSETFMICNSEDNIFIESLSIRLGDKVEITRGSLNGFVRYVENTNNEPRFLIRTDALEYARVKINASDLVKI